MLEILDLIKQPRRHGEHRDAQRTILFFQSHQPSAASSAKLISSISSICFQCTSKYFYLLLYTSMYFNVFRPHLRLSGSYTTPSYKTGLILYSSRLIFLYWSSPIYFKMTRKSLALLKPCDTVICWFLSSRNT